MRELQIAKKNFLSHEKNLSKYACFDADAIRMKEESWDVRSNYFHDTDRIIYSLSYTRYLDKTQVFTRVDNDHITKRITHVQMVSKIARTIGRSLALNEDLIEAIALGHDIGHTPLGHEGEAMLNEISLRELGEFFAHNIQSVRHLMVVENNGKGLNLSLQVYDGIMCHNGELLDCIYYPAKKTKKDFFAQYANSYQDIKRSAQNRPMTLEGCVVRISDIIGYIGRDIEDAIMIGKIKREEIPTEISNVLGVTNRDIVNTVILDIIKNSMNKPYIKMSKPVFDGVMALKDFNYKHIYQYSLTSEEKLLYKEGMNRIFKRYLEDIENHNVDSIIYKIFLNSQVDEYLLTTSDKRKVIDFIAGMTDELFLREIKNYS